MAEERTIHQTSSLTLFYPSKSLSQSLYRFPRIKLVLIVSRREPLIFVPASIIQVWK